MRVLICPDSFTGTLTAVQAAEAMAAGWRRHAPGDALTLAPLSDGDVGFATVLESALGGISVGVTVSDPLGREVPARVLLVETGGVRTAYVEAAQAAGLHLLNAVERAPIVTSTYGVGELVDAALEEGARRVVVSLGGTATNDGGAGMLAALGAGDPAVLSNGGGRLIELTDDALSGLPTVQARLADIELVAATEETLPLLGFQGCSAVTAPRKGASRAETQLLESALGHFTEVVSRSVVAGVDLFTGLPRRLDRLPGSGAGGGLGYALMVLGGVRQSAVDHVLRAWDVERLLTCHDLVLTGEGCFDWESLTGSVLSGVAQAAARHGVPAVVLAGQVQVGRRETMSAGISGAYAVATRAADIPTAMADPVGTLRERAERIAMTWSP